MEFARDFIERMQFEEYVKRYMFIHRELPIEDIEVFFDDHPDWDWDKPITFTWK